MKAHEYILLKQIKWALNQGRALMGSKGQRGRPTYASTLDQNLFEPLEPEVRKSFERGDGNEINGNPDSPAKMQAVHSSSAMGVNIFHYWKKNGLVPEIAAACGFCRKGNHISQKIVFEDKYPIDGNRFRFAPNIDVVIHNSDSVKVKRFAVECKFSEAYSSHGHSGLKEEYLKLNSIWDDIPSLHSLAKSICPDDKKFLHLHPAQLIKHILGLKTYFGKEGFRLLYFWYDVFGEEGVTHKKEIDTFVERTLADGIKFHALSVQELIIALSNKYRSDHTEYVRYISGRYL